MHLVPVPIETTSFVTEGEKNKSSSELSESEWSAGLARPHLPPEGSRVSWLTHLRTGVPAGPSLATRGTTPPGGEQRNHHRGLHPATKGPTTPDRERERCRGEKVSPCTGLSGQSQTWSAAGCIFTTAASSVHSRLGSGFPCLGSLLP